MSKLVVAVVENCDSCPFIGWKPDDNPMGGNGWPQCNRTYRVFSAEASAKSIDPKCPLPNIEDFMVAKP